MRDRPDQFNVRLPEGMRDRLKEMAEKNCRSMNAEVIYHLRRAAFDPLEMKKGEASA